MAMTVSEPERPEIVLSWQRSRLFGLKRDTVPRLEGSAAEGPDYLARAARPLLDRLHDDLGGTPAGIFLADGSGQIVTTRCPDRSLAGKMADLGITAGVELGEDRVGTNAVGTPAEIRAGMLICGPEHFMTTFWGFACYGHPIVHPLTRHLEGVLDISCLYGDEHPLFPQLVRRVVGDIEDQLYRASPRSHHRLLAAFGAATRRGGRAIVALGEGFVLANAAALDLLEAADHATLRAYAQDTGAGRERTEHITLASGRTARLSCAAVDSGDGVVIDIVLGAKDAVERSAVLDGWPLLIVGEPGTGRTTAAIRAGGRDSTVVDAADALGCGERRWAHHVGRQLEGRGPAVIVENVQLLSERVTALLAKELRSTDRVVVLTSTPGCHLEDEHASLAGLCCDQRRLAPLRHRRPEIPRLAQQMLAAAAGTADVRLTTAALNVLAVQSWPGNLSELRRVVERLARARSAGDITPADIPPSHRRPPMPASPFAEAERDVILAAVDAAHGNKVRAAQALGISRSTLYNRIRALRLDC